MGIARLTIRGVFDYGHMVSFAIYVWGFLLAWLIYQRRNWARWVYLVLIAVAVLDFAFSPSEIRRLLARPALEVAWFCFQSLLSPAAVALLFFPPSNDWFRQRQQGAP
jgi:hypothetical protein